MTTFRGQIEELENILVDNFISYQTHTCFFLSHCHSDHMLGLDQLISNLDKDCISHVYCSSISRLILLNKFNHVNKKLIKELTLPQVITVPGNDKAPSYQLTVTPVPAGHCPGSIMFLFETKRNTVLYTGDFRILKNDISKFKLLHNKNEVKLIDKLYLDSTFLNKVYWNFPSRSEVTGELVSLVRKWLYKGPNHKVLLVTSALFGYEFVYVELGRNLKCKICVKDFLHDLFWNIPEVGSVLTKDCKSTKVHVASVFDKKCLDAKDDKVLSIKLSAQWYKSAKDTQQQLEIWKEISANNIVMCFATHCSCSELVDFLYYLRPKVIKPCTAAVGSTEEDTKAYIQEICRSWKTQKRHHDDGEVTEKVSPLEKNYKFKLAFPQDESTTGVDDFEEFFV